MVSKSRASIVCLRRVFNEEERAEDERIASLKERVENKKKFDEDQAERKKKFTEELKRARHEWQKRQDVEVAAVLTDMNGDNNDDQVDIIDWDDDDDVLLDNFDYVNAKQEVDMSQALSLHIEAVCESVKAKFDFKISTDRKRKAFITHNRKAYLEGIDDAKKKIRHA